MAIRRLSEHVSRHDWFAAAVEFVIVVAGVFVGLQASNWNQGRLDRVKGSENRAMLVDDLKSNRQNLDQRKRYYQWVRGEALKTLASFDQPPSRLGGQFLIDAYQSSQTLPWSLKRNTYDQIIAAGEIGNIGDAELRDKVTNYYATTETTGANLASIPPYKEALRRTMPYAAQQAIRTDCGEKIVDNERGETTMVLPQNCTVRLDPTTVHKAVEQVRNSKDLGLDLNRLLVDLDQKLISVDLIGRRAAILEQALRSAP